MKWIESLMNNQFLFYSLLAILSVGAIIIFTLIYMDRKNLRLFQVEEEELLEEQEVEQPEESVKITQITSEPEENQKANLEEVLQKMQSDLEKKEDVVAIFEQEQEEKAIISYQELLNSRNKNTTGTNKELLSVIEQIESGNSKNEVSYDVYETEEDFFLDKSQSKTQKFKTTDFISPVYGKVENHIEYPRIPSFSTKEEKMTKNIELDKKLEILEDEKSHNDAFLNALKEFRSHLE